MIVKAGAFINLDIDFKALKTFKWDMKYNGMQNVFISNTMMVQRIL